MSKDICFIINPVSGTGKWKGIEENIHKYLDKSYTPHILYTKYAGHATELAREAAEQSIAVIAVGGDGMMNEVAKGVMGTNALLGIIPTGSGNALARHLRIPVNHWGAIQCINTLNSRIIDSATMNEEDFIAVCGTGYDAEVANKFAKSKTRGFSTYLSIAIGNYFSYKPAEYEIIVDGNTTKERAFLISIANGSQYGNNAHIAPHASTRDGKLDVCILKPFPLYIIPILVFRLFRWSMDSSPYMKVIQGKNIRIRNIDTNTPLCIHYDGEPGGTTDELRVEVAPKTLRIIVPKEK